MLLHGGERFTYPGSELESDLAEGIEDILSPGRLRLFLIEDVAGVARSRSQAEDVFASQALNRALESRCAPCSLTDFPCDFRREPRILRPGHQSQRLLHLLIRD